MLEYFYFKLHKLNCVFITVSMDNFLK